MSGYSVDEQTIADFLRRLGSSSYFTGVDLEETTQVTQENVKQKKFTLKAQVNYAGGPPPARPRRAGRAGRAAARQDGGREAGVADHDRLGRGGDAMMSGLFETISEWPIKQKIAALIGVVLVVGLLDYTYILSPKLDELAETQKSIESDQATLEQKRMKVNARAEEEKRIATSRPT
jgi:hypothetical protein